MIISNAQLDDDQLKAVSALCASCKEFDGGVPTLYYHLLTQKRNSENNVLYFQDEKLVGFLSVYFFYTDACEVSLLVAPTYRRQGIARALLHAMMPLVRAKEMKGLIFSMPSHVDHAWLNQFNASYWHSEYRMERNSYEPILIPSRHLTIRKASLHDIPDLCIIDKACFSGQQEDMVQRFQLLLNDSNYTLLLACFEQNAVGKAHIHWQKKGAILSDIAVRPEYQGQGWGGEILAYCINHALPLGKTKLQLDVETSNRNALNLYIRHGFITVNASDYWRIPLEELDRFLKEPG